MKPALKESLYLSLLVAVPLAVTALVGFGKDVNPHTDFDKKLASLDYVWTHGRWVTYYEKANKLAIAILDASTNANQNVAATKLMEVLLSKDFRIADLPLDDLYEHGVEDLGVMEKLAGYLESNTAATTEQHRANLWLVCRFLGKMRSEIVPGYRDKPVCANVPPPAEYEGYSDSNMAPDDIELNITDPKIRTKYRAAIRENAQNQSMNSRQEKLRTASEVQVYNLIGDLSEAFATWDNSATTLARYIKEARLTEEEKKKVTDGIAAKLADIKATEESEQPNDNKVRGSMEPPSRKQ